MRAFTRSNSALVPRWRKADGDEESQAKVRAPADDETAVREFERLRQGGAGYIAFAWPAFWWLEHYARFARHLRSRFRCVVENQRLVVFDLRGGA